MVYDVWHDEVVKGIRLPAISSVEELLDHRLVLLIVAMLDLPLSFALDGTRRPLGCSVVRRQRAQA